MKRGYKLKLVRGLEYPLFLVVLCELSVINVGFAQNPQLQQSFQGRSIWGGQYPQGRPYYVNPHNAPISPPQYPYGSPQGSYRNGGGRIVEAVKASIHPLHFHGDNQESYNSPPNLYANGPGIPSSAAASSPAQYSGYFYVQDKHRKPYQPPASQPFYTNAYNLPTNNLWNPVAKPSLSGYHPHAPLTRPLPLGSRYPPVPATSGPVTSASMDTYKEALDLFTEVVHKLEREPVNSYGLQQSPSYSYPQSTLVSNGIYGSSLPSALTSGRFPHHLDHIMGPEFRQKAQKLYNKIIKEQNERLSVSQQQHSYQVRPPPQSPSPLYNPNLPQRGYRGLSYLEGMIHGRAPSYGRPSQYARSMTVDAPVGGAPLMETAVKSLEVNVPNSYGQKGSAGSTEEFMVTSESEMSPQVSLPPSSPNDSQSNHIADGLPPIQFSTPSSLSDAPEMVIMNQPSPSASTSLDNFPRSIPLNENDYIEHPLPYDEYEGLIKDLAINHNY